MACGPTVRSRVAPKARLLFAGATAWRASSRAAASRSRSTRRSSAMARARTLISSITRCAPAETSMSSPSSKAAPTREAGTRRASTKLCSAFTRWCKDLKSLLEADASWRCWSLYRLAAWTLAGGRIALLGDAAHPVLPYLAQGAALAIEDAVVIAECLAERPRRSDCCLPPITKTCGGRALRASRVCRGAIGWLYHLRGPLRLARNLALERRNEDRALQRLDWLYGTPAQQVKISLRLGVCPE